MFMGDLLGLNSLIKRFDRQVWALFGANIIAVMGTSLVMTFMSIYMYENLGMSMTQVGIADFITAIAGAAAAYGGGSLCDIHGRKKILVAGLTLQILSYLLIIVTIDARASIPIFVLALTINSFNGGIYKTIPDVMIADIVKPYDLVEAYGLTRIGANLGWVFGPVIGGLCLIFTSYANLFFITAFTTFLYLMIALFILRDTKKATRTVERFKLQDIIVVARDTPFLLFCLLMMFMIIPYQQMYTLFSVYSSSYVGLSNFWIGVLFALSGLMVALLQYYISQKVSRHKMTTALAVSALIFLIGFCLLSVSTAFIIPFIAMGIITFAEMIWSPASSTLQAGLSPEKMRGRYFGFNGLTGSIGWAIGPLFGGILKDSMNNNVPQMWIVIGAMFLICAIGFVLLNRVMPIRANDTRAEEKLEKIVLQVKD